MQMECIFSSATSSISHIFGNVAKAMEMHIKSYLPKGFIKDSTVSTRVAYRHFQRSRSKIPTGKDIHRKEKPCLIIRPVIEVMGPNDDSFLLGTMYTRNDGALIGPGNDIQEFLEDKFRGFGTGFRINRYRVSFEFEIDLSTTYASYDLYHYLMNTIPWEIPQYLPTPLESMIPRNILQTIARYIGVDINKSENISTFLQYLRDRSKYPITYMMRNATSRNEFFIYYMQNMLVTFSDLSVNEADYKGMTEEECKITFRASCEFNVLGSYVLYGKEGIMKKMQTCIHIDDTTASMGSYVPIFTFNFSDVDKDMVLKGFTQYTNAIIRTDDANDGKDDTFDFRQFLSDEDYQIYLDYLANGNPADLLFTIKLFKERYDLDKEVSWDVDWNKLTVTIHNSDKFASYRFILYVNLNYLNSKKLETSYPKKDQQTIESNTNHGYNI